MQHGHASTGQQRESLLRRTIDATVVEMAHLHKVVDEGESDATPAILVGAVLAFVVPLVAILILLVFVVAYLS